MLGRSIFYSLIAISCDHKEMEITDKRPRNSAVVRAITPQVSAIHDIAHRLPPPVGFKRTEVSPGSFAHYLRYLPLKAVGSPVLLFDGTPKARRDVHAAVVDMPTGKKDLHQCADAIIRLRAEYLFANDRQEEIAFNLTNGFRVPWSRWRDGERVRVNGNTTTWYSTDAVDGSHAQLQRYLEFVFIYAGTLSLSKELQPAAELPMEAGDVFIQGGSPGHAVLVLDVAYHPSGRTAFLLGQSYMPAQDFHVLKNLKGIANGAWYFLDEVSPLVTPEWTFDWSDRRRWAVVG